PVQSTSSSVAVSVTTSSSAASANTLIPPVLYASPSVVLDVRDPSPVAVIAVNQSANETAEDAALIDLAAATRPTSSTSKSKSASTSLEDSDWESLISDLATDRPD